MLTDFFNRLFRFDGGSTVAAINDYGARGYRDQMGFNSNWPTELRQTLFPFAGIPEALWDTSSPNMKKARLQAGPFSICHGPACQLEGLPAPFASHTVS